MVRKYFKTRNFLIFVIASLALSCNEESIYNRHKSYFSSNISQFKKFDLKIAEIEGVSSKINMDYFLIMKDEELTYTMYCPGEKIEAKNLIKGVVQSKDSFHWKLNNANKYILTQETMDTLKHNLKMVYKLGLELDAGTIKVKGGDAILIYRGKNTMCYVKSLEDSNSRISFSCGSGTINGMKDNFKSNHVPYVRGLEYDDWCFMVEPTCI